MDDLNIHIDELVLDESAFDDHRAAAQIRGQLGIDLPWEHGALVGGAISDAIQDRMRSPRRDR